MRIRIENPPIKTYLRSRPRLPIFDSFLDVPSERQPVPRSLTVHFYVARPLFCCRIPGSFSGSAQPCLLSELPSTCPAWVRVICVTVSAVVLRAVRLDNGQSAPACSRCSLPQTDRRTGGPCLACLHKEERCRPLAWLSTAWPRRRTAGSSDLFSVLS